MWNDHPNIVEEAGRLDFQMMALLSYVGSSLPIASLGQTILQVISTKVLILNKWHARQILQPIQSAWTQQSTPNSFHQHHKTQQAHKITFAWNDLNIIQKSAKPLQIWLNNTKKSSQILTS